LRGRAVLIDFWDYTCVNCIRTLPYVQAWHERYQHLGLTVIGVHTPEFTFAQYESNVERGVLEFALTYPIVMDSNYELWKAFANRCWPSKYLLDREGYLRFGHFGEGAYAECEAAIQELLREIDPGVSLPSILQPLGTDLGAEAGAGAACYSASPELYLGHKRGRIGNPGGFQEDRIAEYSFPAEVRAGKLDDLCFYADGTWASTVEYLEAVGERENHIRLKYSGAGVNLVMAAPRGGARDVIATLDGKAIPESSAGADARSRQSQGRTESFITVERARMYSIVNTSEPGEHLLDLQFPAGVAAFAFTFTSCVLDQAASKSRPQPAENPGPAQVSS
jgi:thiol-disulfide isomerase/thioredoxin